MTQNVFSCCWRVTQRQVMRYLTRNGSNRYQNGSSNLLTPYREQPRLTRIVVSSPRPLLSAAKRAHHAQIRFDQQAHNSQGHTSYRNKENGNIDVYGGGNLELVRLAHELASSLPKPCASLKTPHNLARSLLLVGPRRKKTDRGQRSAFPSDTSRFAHLTFAHRVSALPRFVKD